MGVLDRIRGLIKSKSNPPIVHWLHPGNAQGEPFVVGQHYLRLWASDMYLEYDRIGPWGVCPGVQSLVVLTFGDQRLEVPGFIGPGKIAQTQAGGRDAIRVERQVLTQQLPYRGGLVEVESVLLRLPGENHFQAFTTFLEGVAETLVLGEISASLKIAEKVGNGVADLLSLSDKGRLMLGWMTDFPDQGDTALHSGFVLLVPHDSMSPQDLASLKVKKGLLYQPKRGLDVRVEGLDFLLLEFERILTRVDWEEISSIAKPLAKARDYADEGSIDQARAFYRAAILAVRQTRDLTLTDKEAAIAKVNSWMPAVGAPSLGVARSSRQNPYAPALEDEKG